jgi:hypothetical protein
MARVAMALFAAALAAPAGARAYPARPSRPPASIRPEFDRLGQADTRRTAALLKS